MAKSYHHSRDSNIHTSLFLIILIGGFAWSHQGIINRAEHIIPVIFIGLYALFISFKIFKSVRRIRGWKRLRNPELAIIDKMTGLEFEEYVAKLLVKQGYKHVHLTEKFDLGVDIIAEKDGLRYGIQVKRYRGIVKASAVRQVVTALKSYDCDRAMVITNSTYSQVAKRLADSNNCLLIDQVNLQ